MHVAPCRFKVLDLVSRGAIGAVYRALDVERQETVALKVPLSPDSATATRFEHEAELLASLHHPSVPSIVNADASMIVMRYVEGYDLAERLARRTGPFPVRTVLEWADQVLDVLSYLHARGIVHHDVKPANLKIDATGRVVLLDFGLAGNATACGYTASYAPPEQVCGGSTGPRSDLYALGATMYELLTRRVPPPAEDRVVADRLASVHTFNRLVSAEVAAVVHQALALRLSERPLSARSMRRSLQRVA